MSVTNLFRGSDFKKLLADEVSVMRFFFNPSRSSFGKIMFFLTLFQTKHGDDGEAYGEEGLYSSHVFFISHL